MDHEVLERLSLSNTNQCRRISAVGLRSCRVPRSVCPDCHSSVRVAQFFGFGTCWESDRKYAPTERRKFI